MLCFFFKSTSPSLKKYLRSPFWVLGTALSTRDATESKTDISHARKDPQASKGEGHSARQCRSQTPPLSWVVEDLGVLRSRVMQTKRSISPFREATPVAAWTVHWTGGGGPGEGGAWSGSRGRICCTSPPDPTPNSRCFGLNTIPGGSLALAFPKTPFHPQGRQLLPWLGRFRRSKRQGLVEGRPRPSLFQGVF